MQKKTLQKIAQIILGLFCVFVTVYINIKIDIVGKQISFIESNVCLVDEKDLESKQEKDFIFGTVFLDVQAVSKATNLLKYIFIMTTILIFIYPIMIKLIDKNKTSASGR